MEDIAKNLFSLREKINKAEAKYGRKANSVSLLAASKAQSIDKIEAAFAAGQLVFGENYLQEALDKISVLPKEIEWHYIGKLQRNKTRKIAEHFAWVHTVCDVQMAKRLNDQRPASLPVLNICLEVNVDHEASKSGVNVSALFDLATACQEFPRLRLRGLMCIPAAHAEFETQRESFNKLASALQDLNLKGFALDTLSMGMSHDFEAAIAAGATIVRIGSALFGARK